MSLSATIHTTRCRLAGIALAALFAGGLLAACVPPQSTSTRGTPVAADTSAPAPTASTPAPAPAPALPGTGTAAEASKPAGPVKIDASCRSNADCTVKNVGNCCGAYPACVNVNSPTDPQGVQAECARSGRMSVCGFREISACQCVQGQCEAAGGGLQVR